VNAERGREPGEWSEEALLDWLLEDEGLREPSRSTLVADSEVGAQLIALEDWLGRCRGALAPAVDDGQLRRTRLLARRILSDTTREDLSWRGDLRLVAGYVGERLRASLMEALAQLGPAPGASEPAAAEPEAWLPAAVLACLPSDPLPSLGCDDRPIQ